MKTPLLPVQFNIDYIPQLNHPLVRAYIDPDVELDQIHIDCIYDAIEEAEDLMHGR